MFGRKKKSKLPPGCREILLKGRDAKRFRNIVAEKAKIERVIASLRSELDGYDRAGAVVAESYIRTGERWRTFNARTSMLVVQKVEKPREEAPCPPKKP